MDETLPWFRDMPADQRSWVMLVAQAGIAVVRGVAALPRRAPRLTTEVFGAAPAGAGPLGQPAADRRAGPGHGRGGRGARSTDLAAPGEEAQLREAVLRYTREIAFAAAQVYARAAEAARRLGRPAGGAGRGRAAARRRGRRRCCSPGRALGWAATTPVAVVVGAAPKGDPEQVLDAVQRAARHAGLDVLAGVHGDRLVVVLGGVDDAVAAPEPLCRRSGPGRWWSARRWPTWARRPRPRGPRWPGCGPRPGWPAAPRPVLAEDLLAERALAGDAEARAHAGRGRLPAAGRGRRSALLDTVDGVPESGGIAGRRGPGAVRAPEHGPLPAAPGRRGHRLRPDRGPRSPSPSGWRSSSAAST